jgi:hypothetical protein
MMTTPEITPAAIALLGLIVALLLHDYVSLEKNRRLLLLQALVFIVGGGLIVFPEVARRLAHSVGIGRGVDFVIYPLVIWLVRESLLSRRRRLADEQRTTEIVRALASATAKELAPHSSLRAPEQSTSSSAS